MEENLGMTTEVMFCEALPPQGFPPGKPEELWPGLHEYQQLSTQSGGRASKARMRQDRTTGQPPEVKVSPPFPQADPRGQVSAAKEDLGVLLKV